MEKNIIILILILSSSFTMAKSTREQNYRKKKLELKQNIEFVKCDYFSGYISYRSQASVLEKGANQYQMMLDNKYVRDRRSAKKEVAKLKKLEKEAMDTAFDYQRRSNQIKGSPVNVEKCRKYGPWLSHRIE